MVLLPSWKAPSGRAELELQRVLSMSHQYRMWSSAAIPISRRVLQGWGRWWAPSPALGCEGDLGMVSLCSVLVVAGQKKMILKTWAHLWATFKWLWMVGEVFWAPINPLVDESGCLPFAFWQMFAHEQLEAVLTSAVTRADLCWWSLAGKATCAAVCWAGTACAMGLSPTMTSETK